MQAREVLDELASLGSEATRKTWRRHGVAEPMFGVKYGDLEALRKRLGRDHALAQALWRSGNHDARVLAAMIADPAACDAAALDAWRADATSGPLIEALTAHVASRSPAAREVLGPWLASADAATRQAGWSLVAHLARGATDLEDSFFAPLVRRIEAEIAAAPSRAREAMNWALIGIGARSDALAAAAVAAARRIGPVEVDHGDTACKTPDAATYIAKARDHAARRPAAKTTASKSPAAKTGTAKTSTAAKTTATATKTASSTAAAKTASAKKTAKTTASKSPATTTAASKSASAKKTAKTNATAKTAAETSAATKTAAAKTAAKAPASKGAAKPGAAKKAASKASSGAKAGAKAGATRRAAPARASRT